MDLNSNCLSGGCPSWAGMQQLEYLDLSFNTLQGTVPNDLPPSISILRLSNNVLAGSLPRATSLQVNLSYLDVSHNRLSGSLPSKLPPRLAVLNASHNMLSSRLPATWSAQPGICSITLDNNDFEGRLPPEWAEMGAGAYNSVQVSILNAGLSGKIPWRWIEQFCLTVYKGSEARVLFQPPVVSLSSADHLPLTFGTLIVLPVQHALINVTLESQMYSFTYQNTGSVCGIPHAVRNVILLWGLFVAVLLAAIVGVCMHLRSKSRSAQSTPGKRIPGVRAFLIAKGTKSFRVLSVMWFIASDVAYFLYSQVSDIVVVCQVLALGHSKYGYIMLGLLLLQYLVIFIVVACASIKGQIASSAGRAWPRKVMGCFMGWVRAPVVFCALEVGWLLDNLTLPVPGWLQRSTPDFASFYRLRSSVESLFNAVPQSVVQSYLYLLGNSAQGTGQYIDTWLFLYSVSGSLISIIKTVLTTLVEVRSSTHSFREYLGRLLALEPINGVTYAKFVSNPVAASPTGASV